MIRSEIPFGEIRVLQSVRDIAQRDGAIHNPYIDLLVKSLPADVVAMPFRWSTALFGRYHVFHSQWPETIVRSRSRAKRVLKYTLFAIFLLRLRVLRVGVVQTAHNDAPHEQGPVLERWLLRRFASCAHVVVDINAVAAAGVSGAEHRTILHGEYTTWLDEHPRRTPKPGRLASVGVIRSYKKLPSLLRAFGDAPDADWSLSIAGSPSADVDVDELRHQASQDPRVLLTLRHLTEAEMVAEMTESCLVVLPYSRMKNSGAGIYALSLGRPILVPRNPENVALQREVGAEWVHMYDGELAPSDIADALGALPPDLGRAMPDLSRRRWADHGREYRDAYIASLRAARRRPERDRSTSPARTTH